VSYGIRRCEFDDYLLRRSGARLELGRPLREMRRSAGGWTIDGRIQARLLVGAGGHFCPVARLLGARPGKTEPAILAQEIEFPLDTGSGDAVPDAIPRLLFCADLRGYGWVFRKGGWLNVGLGRDDPDGLSAHVMAFVEAMRRSGRIPSGTPSKLRGHAYLLRDHAPRRSYDEATLLIGDAAGLAYPQSGEGIRPAVESAILAAEAIVAARGDYRKTRLALYEAKLDGRFGRRRNRAQGTERFAAPVKRLLGRRLLGLPWFASRVVVDRWFLHRDVPPLSGAA
jgi:flavin-dependent dehydrogenase